MKKKVCWILLAALILSILFGWLRMVLGRQVYLYTLVSVAAFALGWLAPVQSWLTATILALGNLCIHLAWSSLHLVPGEPFSWLGDVILPVVFYLPAAFFGSALGWMHGIVKDDF